MLRFRSLASGSSGNATVIEAGDGPTRTRLLVDCGLGLRQLSERLARAGLTAEDLDGVFITHEHSDHVGQALTLAERHRLPLWMSHGTHVALGQPMLERLHLVRDGQGFACGALSLTPFTVPHDAREPLQLLASDGDRRLGLLTDLGHVSRHVLQQLAGCHALLLECNHDPDRLAASRYPPFLKRRVSGPYGHLSNGAAGQALQALQHPALHVVVAAHLSQRNNLPALARAALALAVNAAEDDFEVADADGGTPWYSV